MYIQGLGHFSPLPPPQEAYVLIQPLSVLGPQILTFLTLSFFIYKMDILTSTSQDGMRIR
jgi:hypothetical protein